MGQERTEVVTELAGWSAGGLPAGGDGAPLVGQSVQGYRLTRQLAGGGMAWIYEATSEKWPRALVLKLPAGGRLASAEARQRFRREIQAVKALSHAQIVGVIDEGEWDGVPFMVMPLVEGTTLDEWVATEEPTLESRLAKFEELCAIIAAVHGEGKMHRDLKPENVMVDKHGTVRLLDFGLARSLTEPSGITREGTVLGTPNCMAPEQTGTQGALGPAADVYALGVILHWLLTGQYPIRLRGLCRAEILVAIQYKPPTRVGALNRKVPAALERLVGQCLEKEPGQRPADAAVLRRQLQEALAEGRAGAADWLQSKVTDLAGPGVGGTPDSNLSTASLVETAGGAVPLKSPFYVERKADRQFVDALVRAESIVLLHGPRQIGKTSLLARGLQALRQSGRKVVLVDFQALNATVLHGLKPLYLHLGAEIADQLGLPTALEESWDERRAANTNFERFLTRRVLPGLEQPLVWAMDEVDRVFPQAYCSELFGMFRSWHNARSLNPDGLWGKLSLAMAYATEAKLFITDPNQSPFNIGVQLALEDFSLENVLDLNRRHENPLGTAEEVERLHRLVGGHPFLVRRALNYLVKEKAKLGQLEETALAEGGPFAEHLRHAAAVLTGRAGWETGLRALLRGEGCGSAEEFYRLRSAGLLAGETPNSARPRCQLYERFFSRLVDHPELARAPG